MTGWTPLTAACYYGYPDVVRLLLQNGADPNVHDLNGGTPLMKAVTLGTYENKSAILAHKADIVQLLLAAGADPNVKDSFGDTPWEAALISEDMILVDVFDNAGVKPVREHKLLYEVSHNDLDAVKKLLAKGVDVNFRDEDGFNALSRAILANNLQIVQTLIQADADVNARYGKGWTPLMIAIAANRVEIVRELLVAGADPSLTADDGTTAGTLCSGKAEIEELLKSNQTRNVE